MTYAAPSFDFYDDGLVHSHEWSRSTPPGQHHKEAGHGRTGHGAKSAHEHDEQRSHDR
jgi:hypothetical protein